MASKTKKRLGINPKDLVGRAKASLSKVPAIASGWCAAAFMDGARKYNAYNWRENAVIASVYVDAAKRHLDQWFEGERCAEDSGVHHLGHAMACCAILLDAEATGNLVSDRQDAAEALKSVYAEIAALTIEKSK